ncbi:MAG TPA: hydantoinase/oxoprolinase family protein [Methylomirabilota bacterium]|nr:hydantoinase/oxoprolinase family protein [Methylomirabilota bacterium]
MGIRIGVDVGGTFTDVVLIDSAGGRSILVKVPSTTGQQAHGVLEGVRQGLAEGGWRADAVDYFAHGTTVATNAVLERKGARTALVTTAGFRDLLLIGRQTRPHLYDARARRPPPLAPRSLTLEIRERVGPEGEVITPLDATSLGALVEWLAAVDVESVAVVCLHSYANPAHERAVADVIRRARPEVSISLSSDVLPEPGEYERASTTVMNAYVTPPIARYLSRLASALEAAGVPVAPTIMQSNGGVMTVDTAIREKSVHTCLSGPAAGLIGARFFAERAGYANVITVDMGGTSFDVGLVHEGQILTGTEGRIGDLPLRVPMFDITTLGAGGGSLAQVDAGGLLRVGPESAGADPGPACYGRGGERPTVTDANVVLGRLRDGRVLGGVITVSRERAWGAIERHVARPLGLSVIEAAAGICQVVNATMIRGIRLMTTERGHDPREFALLAFGGCGPLHAVDLAQEIGLRTVLIPPSPGLCCAVGLLLAEYRHDFVLTLNCLVNALGRERLGAGQAELRRQAERQAGREHASDDRLSLHWSLDLRYVGQGHQLNVPLPDGDAAACGRAFHGVHRQLYGYSRAEHPVEAVALRLRATAPAASALLPPPPVRPGRAPAEAVIATTEVILDGAARAVPVYDRGRLGLGARLQGPLVVEQSDTTVFIGDQSVVVDDRTGNLVVELPG